MSKENLKDPLVSWLSAPLSFNSHNSGNFHLNEKNEISKLGSPLSNTRNISEIKQKAFFLLLMKDMTYFSTPGTLNAIISSDFTEGN